MPMSRSLPKNCRRIRVKLVSGAGDVRLTETKPPIDLIGLATGKNIKNRQSVCRFFGVMIRAKP